MALAPVGSFIPITPVESVLAREGEDDLLESDFYGVPKEIILYGLFVKCCNPLRLGCVSSSFYKIAHTPLESREPLLQLFSKSLQAYLRDCLKPTPSISQIFHAASAKLRKELQSFIINPVGVQNGFVA